MLKKKRTGANLSKVVRSSVYLRVAFGWETLYSRNNNKLRII